MKVEVGTGQYPWCGPDQCIVWKAPTFENVMTFWDEFTERRLQAAE